MLCLRRFLYLNESSVHKSREYKLYVGKFSPETIPLDRLASYATALSRLLKVKNGVTFGGLEPGSTSVVAIVDWESANEVEENVQSQVSNPTQSDAIREINDLLKRDKTSGRLLDYRGAEVIEFPGVKAPEEFQSPTFREQTTIFGQLVRIGSTDETVHAKLMDGTREYKVTMDRQTAIKIAPHLFGSELKLTGSARFKRERDGQWKMIQFDTSEFEVSEGEGLLSAIQKLRGMQVIGLQGKEAYKALGFDKSEDSIH